MKIILKKIIIKSYFTYLRFKDKIYQKPRKIKRRYIHPKLTVQGFLNSIKDLDYVVLRWFDNLPYVEEGEDIDILVSDAHLQKLDEFLKGTKGYGIPCDIYTCGGLPGTDYRSVPYYPVKLSEKIIKNSILLNDIVRVPNSEHYLLTMMYHVVYHKGFDSHIDSKFSLSPYVGKPDHDYKVILQDLGKIAKLNLPAILTLETLDEFLFKKGWRPQKDTLKKLSKRNIWIQQRFFSSESDLANHWNGFTLFIVREKGIPFLNEIKTLLWDDGFEIIFEQEIPLNKRECAVHNIRGGNWNRGPWPKSGGNPIYVIAVYDLHPLEVNKSLAEKHLGIENARISKTKINIRDHINDLLDKSDWCNALHSADNSVEAFEYASHLIPKKIENIDKEIQRLNKIFKTPYPVIKSLSRHTRRAKIEIINFNGEEAVCKTFKPGRERFMRREILARELKGDLVCISEIIEIGENYIILKKYDDILDEIRSFRPIWNEKKYLPLKVIKEARKVISHYRSLGYECIDFSPGNFIYDRKEGLKVLDFEFLQKGGISSTSLKGCYAWYHIPSDYRGDRPQRETKNNPYNSKWRTHTGVPRIFCIYDVPSAVFWILQVFGIVVISSFRLGKWVICVPLQILKKMKTKLSIYLQKL